MEIKEGTILMFKEKVGCIPEGEWVITRVNHSKKGNNYCSLGLKKKLFSLGCLDLEDIEVGKLNGIIEKVGQMVIPKKVNTKKK